MSNLIKTYTLNGKDSIQNAHVYKLLENKVEEIIKSDFPNYISKRKNDIRNLFKQTLLDEDMREITRPWVIALCLSKIIDEMNIEYERINSNLQIDALKNLKKFFPMKPSIRHSLVTLQTSSEPDWEKFHLAIDAYIAYEEIFKNMDFKNGTATNSSFLKRYAIYSLFYIGEQCGLTKFGKSTKLYKFVNILTDAFSKEISSYFSDYKKIKLKEVAGNNLILNFIFDPNTIISIE